MTLKFTRVLAVVKVHDHYMLMQNFIKLNAAVHDLSCWQRKST